MFVQHIERHERSAAPSGAGKQDTLVSAPRLFQPVSQDGGRRLGERGAAFLAPFTNDAQVGPRAEEQIIPLETRDLR